LIDFLKYLPLPLDLHSIVTSEVRKAVPHNQEDVSKQLVNMTGMLFGLDNDQQSDILLAQLSQVGYIPRKQCCIRIRIGSGFNGFPGSVSESRRAKMTHKH
jgi:hypothetical protein